MRSSLAMIRESLRTRSRKAVILLVGGLVLLGGTAVSAQETVRVSNAEELVRALGPRRIVLLEPGHYDLRSAYRVQSPHVSWEEVYDGQQLVIRDVAGLTLRADLGATILAEPRYSYTLSFLNCRQLRLEGLTLGHTEAGYCVGGVVRLEGCEQIYLEGCALYGSGTVGIEVNDSFDVTVSGSAISQCTAGAVWIRGSAHLSFYDVEMLGNDSWPLVDVAGCQDVRIQDCRIAENFGASLLSVDEDSRRVGFAGTVIERNGTDTLVSEWSGPVDLAGVLILDNAFPSGDRDSFDGEYDEEYEQEYGADHHVEGSRQEVVEQ